MSIMNPNVRRGCLEHGCKIVASVVTAILIIKADSFPSTVQLMLTLINAHCRLLIETGSASFCIFTALN